MTLVIERKNRRALTLPRPGGAITLAFLQTIAVLFALWCAVTGGGRRFRRLADRRAFAHYVLRVMIARQWRKGRFANDPLVDAVRRVAHIVVAAAWYEERASRQMPDISAQRHGSLVFTLTLRNNPQAIPPHDSS